MAESKQYITQVQENGNVLISEEVILSIVTHAVAEVEGIAGPGKKSWGKSIKIVISETDELSIEVNVWVVYGMKVVEIASAVQSAVLGAIDSMTGVKANEVNVNVSGIVRK